MRLVAGTSAKRAIAKQATPKTTLVWRRLLLRRDNSHSRPVAVTALLLLMIFPLKEASKQIRVPQLFTATNKCFS